MKPFRLLAASGALALLAACVTANQTLGPDGRLSYVINCPGVQHSMKDCYAKATDLCGTAGFSVVAEDTDIHLIQPADAGTMVNTSHRSLFVACYAPTPKDPSAPQDAPPEGSAP